ncbi:MAG: ketopantoate reductase family protein [Chloroflexi bacterium]|nr:ketopantoate reductase family protein [Chloroflexota bacterium]
MKILIYGAGAVGGYLGARLSQQKHEVTLITRDVAAQLISANGLAITENGRRSVTRPVILTSLHQAFKDATTYDLLVMSMKSYDLTVALDSLVAFCPDPPPIITIQNGIDVEQPLIDQFGAERIIAGSVTIPLRKETTDHIVVERPDRGLTLAPTQSRQDIKQWVNLFQQTGITTDSVKDYQRMKWSKTLLNIVGNATSAILNRRPETVYKSDILFDLEVRMLQETLAVMKALKIKVIDLPGSQAKRLAFGAKRMPKGLLKPIMTNLVTSGRGGKMPSFFIDLQEGKGKSEVIFHNGAIAKAGETCGIPAPVNMALNDTLMKLTLKETNWRDYDGRPKRLLADVRRYETTMGLR